MQIIIPMSGYGERFRKVGYSVPKPLIPVEGKPMIAHIVDMFPGESNFIFVCNEEHLKNENYRMKEILNIYCPTGKIIPIAPHKLGPVHAVMQAKEDIIDSEPTIVNYCDFTCYWDYHFFKHFITTTKCDGAIPAYKGFHPHSLGKTNYAYIKEEDGWVLDIQEKEPYTSDRMNEFASSGTYYFSSGSLLKKSFERTIAQNLQVKGEFYVSLSYKILLSEKQKVAVFPLEHFMQWGTPQDVSEYEKWSNTFHVLSSSTSESVSAKGSVLIPMAGLGKRFLNEGYQITKPLIEVSGNPMVIQATRDLPLAKDYGFVLRQDMPNLQNIIQMLKSNFPKAVLKVVDRVTEGQACTAMIGLETMKESLDHVNEPLTIGACDSGAIYSVKKLEKLMNDEENDVLVWGVRGHPNAIRNPEMFGWIDEIDGVIKNISVKKPLENLNTDSIVLGTFTFKRTADFKRCVKKMIDHDERVNSEFYIDTAIKYALSLKLKCVLFEVDHYLSWGTPNDLKTFEYWQSCFHKWGTHPYRIERDQRVSTSSLPSLEEKYKSRQPLISHIKI